MGFLTEQIKEKEVVKKAEEKPKEKSEEELAIEKCENNFYSLTQDMLKRFNSIDFEHIKKAFNKAIKRLEDDYIDSMEKKIE